MQEFITSDSLVMQVTIINRQNRHRIAQRRILRLLEFLLTKAVRGKDIRWCDVALILVDNQASRKINRIHLHHDYDTDVITFNYMPLPGDPRHGLCGEIIVNVERAGVEGGRRRGRDHETALYIAHGCDHLTGGRDDTRERAQQMRRRELCWVRSAIQRGLVRTILP